MQIDISKCRPPLRWAGSKRKSLVHLIPLLPKYIPHYIEPFAGSACLVFAVKPDRVLVGDINPHLIEFYNYLKSDPAGVYEIYSAIPANESTYYYIRYAFNSSKPSISRAGYFLYLNRNCFNGIFRVNKRGEFNVPWGGGKVGLPLNLEQLMTAANSVKNATFECDDFEEVVLKNARRGSFVYLDPPYASDEKRVFREYGVDSFSTSDWGRLTAVLYELDRIGARFLLSYAGDPGLLSSMSCWNIGYLDVTRNVGGFKSTRRKYREFIAANYRLNNK